MAGSRRRLRAGALVLSVLLALVLATAAPAGATDGPESVSGEALKALIDDGVTVVDVRRADEWRRTGVVPGALLITAFDERGRLSPGFSQAFAAAVAADQPVVLICHSGRRSAAIADMMIEEARYTKVFNADGGILAWQRDGYGLEPCPDC